MFSARDQKVASPNNFVERDRSKLRFKVPSRLRRYGGPSRQTLGLSLNSLSNFIIYMSALIGIVALVGLCVWILVDMWLMR